MWSIIILIFVTILQGNAFHSRPPLQILKSHVRRTNIPTFMKITSTKLLSIAVDQSNSADTLTDAKIKLRTLIEPTNRGRNASPPQRKEINTLISIIEQQCSLSAPARSPLVEGLWTVQYTDSPPPSNGKLGIFDGVAQQQVSGVIEPDCEKCYRNILRVPPNDWLVANLDAVWEEWDGVLVEDSNPGSWKTPGMEDDETVDDGSNEIIAENDNFFNKLGSIFAKKTNVSPDFGASNWLVTFQTLEIKLLGITLFEKKFDATQRVWRTTYVDEETRIVRAGRTGLVEDELVFFMSRANEGDVI